MTTIAPVDATALAARLRLGVTRLARRLRQEAEAGVTPSMLSALSSAERQGSLTMRDLCHAEQVQPPTMTRIVAALVEAGLVVREPDPIDGRVAWVKVTPDGRRLLERSRRRKEAYLAKALRSLEPEELRTLEAAAEILERLTDAPSSSQTGART
ncbi:MAG TPA: MarR family transcriptional regulator [Actinomycetota bacterium]